MAELKIDTTQLVEAAVTAVFAESNPGALARAMAETVLQSPGSYSRHKTVLDELVSNAVRKITEETVSKIIRENEDEFMAALTAECGGDILRWSVKLVAEKVRAAL